MTVLVRRVTSAGDLAEARRPFKEYEAPPPAAAGPDASWPRRRFAKRA